MNSSIAIFQKFGLTNSNYNYSEVINAFVSPAYLSMAGNSYFNTIRAAEGIIIKSAIGHSHWGMTFLNRIEIYLIKNNVLIADKAFNAVQYSETILKYYAKEMLMTVLQDEARTSNKALDCNEARKLIDKVLSDAFIIDQRKCVAQQAQKYLSKQLQ